MDASSRSFRTRIIRPSSNAPAARNNNLTNHGGPTITYAHVVEIFWGSSWSSGTPALVASELMAFYAQFGTTPEYNTITQYSGIHQNGLTNVNWFDGVNPSAIAVTDAMIQAEVKNYINQHAAAARSTTARSTKSSSRPATTPRSATRPRAAARTSSTARTTATSPTAATT